MRRELTELERLDLAARAEVTEASFYSYSWVFGFFAVITVLLVLESQASLYKTGIVGAYAALATFSAVTIWFRWRYSLYAAASLFFTLAVERLVLIPDRYQLSIWGWILEVLVSACFVKFGYRLLKSGVPFAAVHGEGWAKERTQVREWLKILTNLGTEEQVFEILTGNFWKGYFTYRFMRRDQLWVVVRLKTSNYLRPLEYRILDQAAFNITPLPDGTFYAQIDKWKFREAKVPAQMRESLLRAIGAS